MNAVTLLENDTVDRQNGILIQMFGIMFSNRWWIEMNFIIFKFIHLQI